MTVGVGTPDFAASLLYDLYIRLRHDLKRWASVTHQTPQARMGYVGQHLVSVVTGHPGGRSGARGDDLRLPGGKVAEIKCCYRVDQLGKCTLCDTAVSSIEASCPNPSCSASAEQIQRGDDSKWLLGPRDEKELQDLFVPELYYFVLFEFVDLAKAGDINVQIFSVDPRCLGFSLCMIDYYFNIKAKSKSGAPFNLWPDSPKLYMMKPKMIYWAIVNADDTVKTVIFPGSNPATRPSFSSFEQYSASKTFDEQVIDRLAKTRGVVFGKLPARNGPRRRAKLLEIQKKRVAEKWDEDELADDLARIVYRERVKTYKAWTKKYAPSL